jgi:DnaJ-class molecular chaperone
MKDRICETCKGFGVVREVNPYLPLASHRLIKCPECGGTLVKKDGI